jgi:amino acid transporter
VLLAFIVAMIPVFFAYDGWTDSTYVAGEVIDPKRTLPIAIVWGTVLVIVTYLLTNLAYFNVLSPQDVATYEAVGSETVGRILGEWGRAALAVLVAISTFGTTNGAILTGPRVTQAMAADGLLWKPLAGLDPKRATPSLALWVQGGLSCVWLVFSGGFEDVSGWFVTTSWLFYGLTIAALFVQRRRERTGGRLTEYRTPLYPLTPIVFIVVVVAIIASDLGSSGWRAAAGVIIAALGLPVYALWKGRPRAS